MIITNQRDTLIIAAGGALLLSTIALGYTTWDYRERLLSSRLELASTTVQYNLKIDQLTSDLASTTAKNMELANDLADLKQERRDLKSQLSETSEQLDEYDKLSRLDPELLQKYSKVFFLNENYIPSAVRDVPVDYLYNPQKPQPIHSKVWSFLKKMIDAAKSENINLSLISGYRSFGVQSALKASYKVIYGAGTANQFSADQGYSEHQLGTAVDLADDTTDPTTEDFANTLAYQWLLANAHRYGFILSYPRDNHYYQFEPWHWRFVGIKLATDLHEDNKSFYDLDQREIDKYLLYIFDR